MKAFVAVALAAAAQAAPEADPQLLLAQPQVHVYGNAHAQTMGMVQHANGAVVPDDTLSVKAAKVDHLNAKATAYLNKPLVTVAAQPLIQTVGSMYPAYSGLYHPYALNTHLIKREAEAEAEADPQLLLNAPVTTYGGVHNLAYNGVYNYVKPAVTYTTPVVAKNFVQTPVVAKSAVAPAVYSGLYNYGTYGLNTHMIAKREAEAQFMIQSPYTTHAINYQQPIYGYNMHSMMTPFVYNTHLIKREAEADPALVYSMPAYNAAGLYNQMHYTVAQPHIVPSAVTYTTPYSWY